MKRFILILWVVFALGELKAQERADIFGNAPITWLGLDFSHLRFVGKTATHDKANARITNEELQSRYFEAWNSLFFDERNKFNVAEAVHRDFVGYALDITRYENNKSRRTYFIDSASHFQLLTEDSVKAFVADYDFMKNKGIGLLFFVEQMNKDNIEATMWATFVDMARHKVLLTRRITGKAGGTGFRNFWARSFFEALSSMKDKFTFWQY